jgi:hypothetical protein
LIYKFEGNFVPRTKYIPAQTIDKYISGNGMYNDTFG